MIYYTKDKEDFFIARLVDGDWITVYRNGFTWPDNNEKPWYPAQHKNGSNGFLIDGKPLCFKFAHEQKSIDIAYEPDNDWLKQFVAKNR